MEDCDCKDFEENAKYIRAVIDIARVHGYLLPEAYKYWAYCPWCGKKGKEW